VIDPSSHKRVTLESPQQSADCPKMEDEEEVFESGRKDEMKVPLIP
jgi:hypothetical protein